jgi:alpha-glucosidase
MWGSVRMLPTPEPVLAFERTLEGHTVRAIFNTSATPCEVEFAGAKPLRAINGHGLVAGEQSGNRVRLPAYGVLFASDA